MKRPNCPKCGKPMTRHSAGSSSGKLRWICRSGAGGREICCVVTNPETGLKTQAGKSRGKAPIFKRTLGRSVQRFVITSAQNATPAHPHFLASLKQYCEHHSAELVVIPLRYKNPTSRWSESQENADVWAPELVPYLWNVRKALNKNLVIAGDVKTQPTATQPLTGFEALTGRESMILGHTKLQLRVIPAPANRLPKIITTTGAVTLPNYTDSKAGKLGEFHHSLAAAVVETDGRIFHLRQLIGDRHDGSFYDLDRYYCVSGSADSPRRLPALILGDVHVDSIDPAVRAATFGPEGIVSVLSPQTIVYHDLVDGYAFNPHHMGNPFNALAKRRAGRDNARAEVERACEFVRSNTPRGVQAVVVASNHDDFLRRWVIASDWRSDPANAEFYLETALVMARATRLEASGTVYPSPFAHWLSSLAPGVRALGLNESFVVEGIELGMHGDIGPNGARGSIRNLRRIGIRSFVGHSHTPGIEEGCYQVGTSSLLKLEYNTGPSSWLHSHGLVYPSGKRTLLNIINGEWRLK